MHECAVVKEEVKQLVIISRSFDRTDAYTSSSSDCIWTIVVTWWYNSFNRWQIQLNRPDIYAYL